MLRKYRVPKSLLASPLRRVVLAACAATVVASVSVSGANAMSVISTWRYPGAVREDVLPVTCANMVIFDTTFDQVTANGPTVYARALSNGSTGQWVYEQIKFFDLTTQSVHDSNAGWTWTTTTTPATLPSRAFNAVYGDTVMVAIRLWWWDPVSQTYTGYMDYGVDSYYRLPSNGIPDRSC